MWGRGELGAWLSSGMNINVCAKLNTTTSPCSDLPMHTHTCTHHHACIQLVVLPQFCSATQHIPRHWPLLALECIYTAAFNLSCKRPREMWHAWVTTVQQTMLHTMSIDVCDASEANPNFYNQLQAPCQWEVSATWKVSKHKHILSTAICSKCEYT